MMGYREIQKALLPTIYNNWDLTWWSLESGIADEEKPSASNMCVGVRTEGFGRKVVKREGRQKREKQRQTEREHKRESERLTVGA
jgi:hypothetical protein